MPPPIFSIRDHHHGVRHHHYHYQDSHRSGAVPGGPQTQPQLVDREFQFRLFGWALLALWLGSIVYMTRGFWTDWFRGFWSNCSETSPSASSRCEHRKTLLPPDWLSELDGVDENESIELVRRQQCLEQNKKEEGAEHVDDEEEHCCDDEDDSDEESELFLPRHHHQQHNFSSSKNAALRDSSYRALKPLQH